jgi:outer membrane protein TolC
MRRWSYRFPKKTVVAILCTAIVSCASYRPLPLSVRPDLAPDLAQLRHELPSPANTVIDIGKPLDPNSIGLLAVLNDPELRSRWGQIDVAQAQLVQASLLPNPSANLAYGFLLGGPGTAPSYAASLSQDIAALVTYRARVNAAEAHVAEINAEQLWQEWQVTQKARLLALDLYWGRKAIDAQRNELEIVSAAFDKVRSATAAGNLDLTALSPLAAAKATAEQALASQALEDLKSSQELDGLLGLDPEVRIAIAAPQLSPMPSDVDRRIASLPEQRPDLIALQLGYRSADEDVRAAILGQFPAFTLGGTWNSDTTAVRSAGPTVTFDLPVFNRNQGQVATSEATRLLLQEQYQARLDGAVAGIKSLVAQRTQLSTTLAETHEAAASAEALARSARVAYAQANLDQRAWTDYETITLQRQLEVISLERSLGEIEITLTVELGIGLPRSRIGPPDSAESL